MRDASITSCFPCTSRIQRRSIWPGTRCQRSSSRPCPSNSRSNPPRSGEVDLLGTVHRRYLPLNLPSTTLLVCWHGRVLVLLRGWRPRRSHSTGGNRGFESRRSRLTFAATLPWAPSVELGSGSRSERAPLPTGQKADPSLDVRSPTRGRARRTSRVPSRPPRASRRRSSASGPGRRRFEGR
jgi:hypothetical protein